MINDTLLSFTAGRDMWSTVAANDVPSAKMADGPMGIASGRVDERDVSILTPSGIALAASWDRALAGVVGALVGGFLGSVAFNRGIGSFWSPWTWLLAFVGSVIVLAVWSAISGRSPQR